MTGQSGGGCFVCLYLLFLIAVGLPVMVMEFATGRAAGRSIARLHETLTPTKPWWRLHGVAGLLGNVMLMMFYTTITGWMVLVFLRTTTGAYVGLSPAAVADAFGQLLADPGPQATAMTGVCVGCSAVCAAGLQRGLERVTKWMMLALLGLIVVLAANSVLLQGAGAGLRFYLVPDVSRMKDVGVSTVVVNALNQAFFTLSLGIGAMSVFGSYIDRERSLLGESCHIAALDTFVALLAGLIILPACAAYGVAADQGPSLLFVTMPNVFNHMPGGRIWGSLFFLFMCFAALSTVLAVFENIVACLRDYTGWSRRLACAAVAVILPVLSLPCVLGFNRWSNFHPLGAGSTVLDLEDFIVSDLLLPLGAIAFAAYCCHRFGWGWQGFIAEANAGRGMRLARTLRWYCGFVLPTVIAVIFVSGLLRHFGWW